MLNSFGLQVFVMLLKAVVDLISKKGTGTQITETPLWPEISSQEEFRAVGLYHTCHIG